MAGKSFLFAGEGDHKHGSAPYRFLLISSLLLLTACSHSLTCSMGASQEDCPPGTRGYELEQQAQAKAAAAEAANAAADDAKCKANKLQPDTPAYQRCRDGLENAREQAEASDKAALAGRLLGRPNQ
jgi:hypothetical protein